MTNRHGDRFDIYEQVTATIIQQIEAGAGKWKMPWHVPANMLTPHNTASGRLYNGINVLLLWIASSSRGYSCNEWGTFKQWKDKGLCVRKGERGTTVILYKPWERENAETGETETIRVIRGFTVFNGEQVEGYVAPPAPAIPDAPAWKVSPTVSNFVTATGAVIKHGGHRAYYIPSEDYIRIPSEPAFHNEADYYSTLLHEIVHWTGHENRCERRFGQRFGDAIYAFEELIAEIGSAFLCAELGVALVPRIDHAQYVQSWLKVLKDDKKAIFTAASKAREAVWWLMKHTGHWDKQDEADYE